MYKIFHIKTIDIVAISDLRLNLPSLIKQVNKGFKRIIITVSGKPKAVVLSFDELESLEETSEIFFISQVAKSIEKSKEQIKKGQYITLDQLEEKCLE